MSLVTETDKSGNERLMGAESRLGVLVVEGTVERLTGGGKFVVSPVRELNNVEVGNRVMIVVLDKLQPEVTLETLKERVISPFPSDWAVIVTGNRYVERCNVYYDGRQLHALDPAGVSRSELPLPRDGVLNFRIPEIVGVNNESMVEVRDGDRSIRREAFGMIRASPMKEMYPTVAVSGMLSPLNKVVVDPVHVDFTNIATSEKFSASVSNSKYSVQLPNRESYQATVTWGSTPGNQGGTAQAGTLHLSTDTQAYSFDVSW